jgi:hypothetical protein
MIRRLAITSALVITSAIVIASATGAGVRAQGGTMQQAPPSRDSRAAATGPAEISGVIVTDEETPKPVRRAEVRAILPGSAPRTTHSDAEGRFVFSNLPTGRYTIDASKPGFVRTAYGARRHDRPGTPVTLTDTQRRQVLQLRMPRGAVITGRIVDEFGQPAQGARVRAQLVRMLNGERTLSELPLTGAFLGEAADDRGVYRLYGLPAGEYVISATPRNTGLGDIRRLSESEIRAAEAAVQQPGSAVEPDAPPVTVGFSAVFFPGVLNASAAGGVTVKAGEERQNVDFAVQFVRTANVEGTLITPGGVRPSEVQLLLLPRQTTPAAGGPNVMFTMAGGGRRVDAEGKFSFPGVTPGAYTLSARATQGENGNLFWANADIDVDGQPISGLSLTLQPGMAVSGQLAVEADGVDPPDVYTRARINLQPADGGIMLGNVSAQPSPSGAFSIPGIMPGRYRVTANFNTPEANWILKSAVIKGKDVLDLPFEVAPGDAITNAVLTFTNRTQELTGTLQDASQRPAPDYTVVVFPADKSLWSATRRVRSTRPGTDGTFSFSNLPAGTYRIAAAVDIGAEELRDQALLEELLAASVAFTIADGEKKVQNLRISGGG